MVQYQDIFSSRPHTTRFLTSRGNRTIVNLLHLPVSSRLTIHAYLHHTVYRCVTPSLNGGRAKRNRYHMIQKSIGLSYTLFPSIQRTSSVTIQSANITFCSPSVYLTQFTLTKRHLFVVTMLNSIVPKASTAAMHEGTIQD
jgi:hypothetical protein